VPQGVGVRISPVAPEINKGKTMTPITPIEISDYKTRWLRAAHVVTVDEDLDIEGKTWCRKNTERHKWSFSKYTDMYEHTFYFEDAHTAQAFEQWYSNRRGFADSTEV
jgi:hypothetical protein